LSLVEDQDMLARKTASSNAVLEHEVVHAPDEDAVSQRVLQYGHEGIVPGQEQSVGDARIARLVHELKPNKRLARPRYTSDQDQVTFAPFLRGCHQRVRQRGSSPKLLTLNTALATAMSGETPKAIRADREAWGRLVETAVGAHLVNTAGPGIDVTWWRDRNREVDYVVSDGRRTLAIEVASGRRKDAVPGLGAFTATVPGAHPLLVGAQGLSLEQVLSLSAAELLAD
jgi:hypothetical protein